MPNLLYDANSDAFRPRWDWEETPAAPKPPMTDATASQVLGFANPQDFHNLQQYSASLPSAPQTPQPWSGGILPVSGDATGKVSFDSNAGLLGSLKRSVMLPGDVATGKVQSNAELVDRAGEMAGNIGLSNLARPKPANSLGAFGGALVEGSTTVPAATWHPKVQDWLKEDLTLFKDSIESKIAQEMIDKGPNSVPYLKEKYGKEPGADFYFEHMNNAVKAFKSSPMVSTGKAEPLPTHNFSPETVDKIKKNITAMQNNSTANADEIDILRSMLAGKSQGEIAAKYPNNSYVDKYHNWYQPEDLMAKHVLPIDWSMYTSPRKFAARPVIQDQNRLDRAGSLGFNTNVPLFKGMNEEMDAHKFWDPSTKPNERAVFATDNAKVANQYANEPSMSSHNLIPMYARAQRPFEVDWKELRGGNASYQGDTMSKVIDHARSQGSDMLVIHNIHDLGGHQTQYAVLDPSILRSRNAQFDPTRVAENNLLAVRGVPLLAQRRYDDDQ